MTVMRHGGAQGRPGTRWVAEVKDSTKTVRLIEFVFNSSQTYALEFGDQYIRVYKNGNPVLAGSPVSVTSITNANPGVVTATAHGFSNGDEVVFGSLWPAFYEYVPGMPEVQNRQFIVANKTANTFELKTKGNVNVDSSAYGTYTSGATVSKIYEVTTTYTESELAEIGYVQSGDTLFLTHPSHPPRKLTRSADNNWTLADLSFGTSVTAPSAPVGLSVSPGGPGNTSYEVSAVNSAGEESLPSGKNVVYGGRPSLTASVGISWGSVSGAIEYNVYKAYSQDGTNWETLGLVGITEGTRYIDVGTSPDFSDRPLRSITIFNAANAYPACVGIFQQRLYFARTNNSPQDVFGSKLGLLLNFHRYPVQQDDDSLQFTVLGAQEIRHLFELGKLVIMTRNGTWVCQGSDGSGAVTPSSPFPLKQSGYPVSLVRPVVVDGSIVFVQTGFPSLVRDLLFQFESQGSRGTDLTIFAPHLFKDFSPTQLAYQERPNSIVWAVRSDGMLCGLTYVREQQIVAWHHHIFSQLIPLAASTPSTAVYPAGLCESICVVPEGGDSGQDFLYLVVKRYNYSEGRTVKSIERMARHYVTSADQRPLEADYYTGPDYQVLPLFPDSVKDMPFMDSAFTYDGRNYLTYVSEPNYSGGSAAVSTKTMTLSGGSAWDETETLTLTASDATFQSTDVGQVEIHLLDRTGNDTYYRLQIEAYTSSTVVTVRSKDGTIPTGLRSTATLQWAKAVKTVNGLWHLEGSEVSVLGDGYVVASPFNSNYDTVRVTNGSITLEECYAVIQVGLPYVQELETLDLDFPQGPGLADDAKNVQSVRVYVEDSKNFFVGPRKGPDADVLFGRPWDIREGELEEAIVRDDFDNYDEPTRLGNGWVDVKIQSDWNSNGRVVIRQVDPLPLTVLAVRPKGNFGRGG